MCRSRAAGAIGRAIAGGLAANGATVFLTDLKQKAVDAAVAAISAGRGRAGGWAADVADESQVSRLVAAAKGGSHPAFAELVRSHQQAVRSFLRKMRADPTEADDAALESDAPPPSQPEPLTTPLAAAPDDAPVPIAASAPGQSCKWATSKA